MACNDRKVYANGLLTIAIALNLFVLGYFKYFNFFISNIAGLGLFSANTINVILPIGISFYTFTQIAYLVDARMGKVSDTSISRYMLFVTYFPHLIAGPILHHSEMIPQFKKYAFNSSFISVGLTTFVIGLTKKVVLADSLAQYANILFANPVTTMAEAWLGSVAYSLQIYFDFSGYTDMAIGISYLFGVRLPINFDSPYKATSIIDFWRRWHISLSRFLRDYLYIPLGGNRRGPARRYSNLMTTMLIGGLWHGAGWTFIIWGGLHGAYLMLNNLWIAIAHRIGLSRKSGLLTAIGFVLTFLAVNVAWVFFRAESFNTAFAVIGSMVGRNGLVPAGGVDSLLHYSGLTAVYVVAALLCVCWLFPNTHEIMGAHSADLQESVKHKSRIRWEPNLAWAIYIGALAFICISMIGKDSPFLYFQF